MENWVVRANNMYQSQSVKSLFVWFSITLRKPLALSVHVWLHIDLHFHQWSILVDRRQWTSKRSVLVKFSLKLISVTTRNKLSSAKCWPFPIRLIVNKIRQMRACFVFYCLQLRKSSWLFVWNVSLLRVYNLMYLIEGSQIADHGLQVHSLNYGLQTLLPMVLTLCATVCTYNIFLMSKVSEHLTIPSSSRYLSSAIFRHLFECVCMIWINLWKLNVLQTTVHTFG